jgi:hypothetical protein
VGEIIQLAADAPTFTPGEKAVLFLQSQQDDTWAVVGDFQGKYTVEGDEIAGKGQPLLDFISDIERIIRGATEITSPHETLLE